MAELTIFSDPATDRLAGLIFELAAQLHVERQGRMAIETILLRRGLVSQPELDELVGDDDFAADVRDALRESQDQLLAILVETDDARHPLRDRPATPEERKR